MFVGRSCIVNKRPLKLLQGVLHRQQRGFERLHSGFASCTKGPWSYFKGSCNVYKKGLKLLQGVLHHVQKGSEVTSRGLASCTKGLWSYFKGLCIMYKRAMNNVKMVLFTEQFGLEVTSSRFCIVYNLSLKLLQEGLRIMGVYLWTGLETTKQSCKAS